jgi:hypothetical protein
MNVPARFLLLIDDAQRAVLLDGEHRHLGDVLEEDGFIVETLLRNARSCPLPAADALSALSPAPSPQARLRCFELH